MAKELSRILPPDYCSITIINPETCLREAQTVVQVSKYLDEVNVFERTSESFRLDNPNIKVIESSVTRVDCDEKEVVLKSR